MMTAKEAKEISIAKPGLRKDIVKKTLDMWLYAIRCNAEKGLFSANALEAGTLRNECTCPEKDEVYRTLGFLGYIVDQEDKSNFIACHWRDA